MDTTHLMTLLLLVSGCADSDKARSRADGNVQFQLPAEQHQTLVATAQAVLGDQGITPESVRSEIITLTHDDSPYVHKLIVGRPVARLLISHYRIRLLSHPTAQDLYAREVELLIDPATQQLLKISTAWPVGAPEMAPMAQAEAAEKVMHSWGQEVYEGFPSVLPKTTLLQAINAIKESAGHNALGVPQIVAHYVLWSTMKRDPQPVWAITYRGVPEQVPRDENSATPGFQYRFIVLAETGRFVVGSNFPHANYERSSDLDGTGD